MSNNNELSAYDGVLYPGHAFEGTHPERLSTLGSFYGMTPAPPGRCRVLELGCGDGGNLIPMAFQYPESEFIGVDLSAKAVAKGIETITALGLTNIELQRRNIVEVTADYGLFDYIISHGVYSWVPADIRERILAIFGDQLTPHGIAYVSYNAHPGSHLRDLVRDMMLFHVRGVSDFKKRTEQARAILKFLAEASASESVHGAVMRDQLARVTRMRDAILFHDDLDADAVPFLLHQVVADAERHGLQYLCDAVLSRQDLRRYPQSVRNVLTQFPDSEFMARDQYQDFIDGYGFRRTLLCRRSVTLNRRVEAASIRRFYLSASLRPVAGEICPGDAGAVEFKNESGDTLATDHRLSKSAILHLGQIWPAAISFPALLEAARQRMAALGDVERWVTEEHVETLTDVLFQAVGSGHIEIHSEPLQLVTTISQRPEVSQLVRRQLATGALVTNLRHGSVMIEDEITRQFVILADGSRTVDQLRADLSTSMSGSMSQAVTQESFDRNLKLLASLALLVK